MADYPRVRKAKGKADGPNGAAVDEQLEEMHEMPGEPATVPEGPTTTNGLTAEELVVVKVPLDDICPDPLNPNEEDPETFNMLVSTISEDGFDQPIVICPIADKERSELNAPTEAKYVISKGEHRYRAARVLGHKTVPAVIRDWDPLTRRTRLVRDNNVRGEVNKSKFTDLVHALQAEHSLDAELASSLLGFDSSKEMFALMVKEQKAKDLESGAETGRAKDELKVLDDLSLVLNTLFTKHGHTLPYGYMLFLFGGKINAMVEMEDELTGQMEELAQICLDRKINMSLMLATILKDGIAPFRTKKE